MKRSSRGRKSYRRAAWRTVDATVNNPKNGAEIAWIQSTPTISRRDSPWNFSGSPK